jgi:hypothetical protein
MAALPLTIARASGASQPNSGAEPTSTPAPTRAAMPEQAAAALATAAAEAGARTIVSDGPQAGNPSAECAIPPEAAAADMTVPDRVVGTGSPASCTAEAFIAAVALGGKIAFDCGPDPVVITLDRPAKVVNDAADDVVIDGGGKVTLSGGDTTRILYMNTCDPEQHWTTPHCDNQATPRLTVQNLTFSHGNATNELEYDGGGAIWARGGQLKVVGSRFFNNTCVETGPDVGGAAIRAFSQFENRPVYVAGSTFGGAPGFGNACANGGGISSINVSWSIYNSVFSHNQALGFGGNPAEDGTPGGGSGGAIYSDGMSDHGGLMRLESTTVRNNTGGGWNVLPGVSMHEDTPHEIIDSILE